MLPYLVIASMALLLVLLVHGRIPPALIFTGYVASFYLLGLIDQTSLLAGYTNPALATLAVLLLVSVVLERSALLERTAHWVLRGRETFAVLRLSGITALLSAFLNNTAVVGALLGTLAKQRRIPVSRLLIPLSFASLLGGITTLVGTSTNLVINSFTVSAGLAPLSIFSFALVGAPVALICLAVLAIAARFLPVREPTSKSSAQPYFLEARVSAHSPMAGRTIEENRLRHLNGIYLLEIEREGKLVSPAAPSEILQVGDVLVFSGEVHRVQGLEEFPGLELFGNGANDLLRSNLVEVVIAHGSDLAGRTLRDVDFRSRFDAGVVGIRRGERRLGGQLGRITLRVGDSLLLAVGADFGRSHALDRDFHLLTEAPLRPRLTPRQSWFSLLGFAGVILAAALGIFPLFSGLLLYMAALLITGTLGVDDLRRRFPFELVMVIGSALGISQVLESTGAASVVAGALQWGFAGHGVWAALLGVYLVTALLTELVTNNAAAALGFPIGLATASAFGVDPLPFIMVVAYAASACFLLPFGYQTHLMVYSPGRYRLADFARVGVPLAVVYAAGVLTLVPLVFPFSPVT